MNVQKFLIFLILLRIKSSNWNETENNLQAQLFFSKTHEFKCFVEVIYHLERNFLAAVSNLENDELLVQTITFIGNNSIQIEEQQTETSTTLDQVCRLCNILRNLVSERITKLRNTLESCLLSENRILRLKLEIQIVKMNRYLLECIQYCIYSAATQESVQKPQSYVKPLTSNSERNYYYRLFTAAVNRTPTDGNDLLKKTLLDMILNNFETEDLAYGENQLPQ